MKRQVYIWIALFALLAWGIWSVLQQDQGSGPAIGSPAPEFQIPDINGQSISLKDFRGKAVLLNFWATWCGPCREEIPSLNALYQRYRDQGFVVLGVSVDEEDQDVIEEFLKVIPVDFPILLDPEQTLATTYETFRIPESFFIDPEGKIVGKVSGPQDYEAPVFAKKVERILPDKDTKSSL